MNQDEKQNKELLDAANAFALACSEFASAFCDLAKQAKETEKAIDAFLKSSDEKPGEKAGTLE